MADKLDVVIFGATGFTGKHAVKELNKIVKERPLSWGIAGRSEEKLQAVLNEWKDKTGDDFSHVKIIVADVHDDASLNKMASQARVIVNCCGPYRFYGEPVIKACIANGTHHVDVSGEPQYMERMQLEYHKAAQEKGVYIVSACGFDSVPSDLGVVYLQDNFDGTVNSIETYLDMQSTCTSGGARLHYGTWESAVYGLAHANELRPLRSKLYPERLPQFKPKVPPQRLIHKSPVTPDAWVIPFLGSDKSVVVRSQRHFFDADKKRPAQVQCYMTVKSLLAVLVMGVFGIIFGLLTKFRVGRYLLLTYPRIFSGGFASHEGPSDEMMESTNFSITVIGKGWSQDKALPEATDQHVDPPNKTTVVKVSGVNPGYGATCVMLLFCGLTILKEADKMPANGGVYPPGAAFAKTSLIQQLHRNGVTFELVSSKEE